MVSELVLDDVEEEAWESRECGREMRGLGLISSVSNTGRLEPALPRPTTRTDLGSGMGSDAEKCQRFPLRKI